MALAYPPLPEPLPAPTDAELAALAQTLRAQTERAPLAAYVQLGTGQRALIAARLVALAGGALSVRAVTVPMDVSRDSVKRAMLVLKAATAAEIRAIEAGQISPTTLARQLRSGLRQDHRARRRAQPITEKGRNPQRLQNQRIDSDLWRRLREALDHLTNLPLPSEVAALVRNQANRNDFVGQRLTRARKWLEEFTHAWHRPDEQA